MRIAVSTPYIEDIARRLALAGFPYAGLDTHVKEGWSAYEVALKAKHIEYTVYIYPNVNHVFHNDTATTSVFEARDGRLPLILDCRR